jgi:hypothetical protein
MTEGLISGGIQYTAYLLEIALFAYLVLWGPGRRLFGVCLLLVSYLGTDWIIRPYTLIHFGLRSREYYYVYWLSDVVLTLEAFGLICFFFRRAFQRQRKTWDQMRQMLLWVFLLVLAATCISLYFKYSNYDFIREYQQNLYFACLVLNTLLYVKMQSMETQDEQLNLLVCGMGIQFAGPTASLAFAYLTRGHHPDWLFRYVTQLCTSGMLLVWFYAIVGVPKGERRLSLNREQVQHLAVGQKLAGEKWY